MGPWEEMPGKSRFCCPHLHPLSLISSKKNPLWGFCVLSLHICALQAAFPGLCWCIPHWTLFGSCPCASTLGGWELPSLPPLLTSEGTARHEEPQDQVFLHPSQFLALPALPFGFAPANWLCGHSLVALRMCSGALRGFLMGRPMDSWPRGSANTFTGHSWVGTSSILHLPRLSWITQSI